MMTHAHHIFESSGFWMQLPEKYIEMKLYIGNKVAWLLSFKSSSSSFINPTVTVDDFATFFIRNKQKNQTTTISGQFTKPQTDTHILPANTHILPSFSLLSEAEVSKLLLSNRSTTCPLDPTVFTLINFKPFLPFLTCHEDTWTSCFSTRSLPFLNRTTPWTTTSLVSKANN